MPTYQVMKESTPGVFSPTGDTFTGTEDEAEAQRQALQASDPEGKCYAMQQQSGS